MKISKHSISILIWMSVNNTYFKKLFFEKSREISFSIKRYLDLMHRIIDVSVKDLKDKHFCLKQLGKANLLIGNIKYQPSYEWFIRNTNGGLTDINKIIKSTRITQSGEYHSQTNNFPAFVHLWFHEFIVLESLWPYTEDNQRARPVRKLIKPRGVCIISMVKDRYCLRMYSLLWLSGKWLSNLKESCLINNRMSAIRVVHGGLILIGNGWLLLT